MVTHDKERGSEKKTENRENQTGKPGPKEGKETEEKRRQAESLVSIGVEQQVRINPSTAPLTHYTYTEI